MSEAIIRCPHCGRRNRVPAAADGTPRCGHCHQPLPWIADAGDDTFTAVAEHAPVPVLADFWAPWCGPCALVSPALEQLATERPGQLKLVKINIDQAPRLQQRFAIQSIPTLMILRDGQILARQAGALPPDALRRWVDQTSPPRPPHLTDPPS